MAGKKKPRTIDERLDALTESVELIAHMQQTNEKKMAALTESVELLAHMQQTTEKQMLRMERWAFTIAKQHNKRIATLERKVG